MLRTTFHRRCSTNAAPQVRASRKESPSVGALRVPGRRAGWPAGRQTAGGLKGAITRYGTPFQEVLLALWPFVDQPNPIVAHHYSRSLRGVPFSAVTEMFHLSACWTTWGWKFFPWESMEYRGCRLPRRPRLRSPSAQRAGVAAAQCDHHLLFAVVASLEIWIKASMDCILKGLRFKTEPPH